MHQAANSADYSESVRRALDWLVGMQSANGGFAAFDADNTSYYLNKIPFADHGALLDPPTSDVTARVVTVLARIGRPQDRPALSRALDYLRAQQEPDGSWFGRWGTNYIYGTWSVLTAFAQAGVGAAGCRRAARGRLALEPAELRRRLGREQRQLCQGPALRHESARVRPTRRRGRCWRCSLPVKQARDAVRRGVNYLMRTQQADGLWSDPHFTAPGFPRVFYLKYHGYSRYFPLWALAAYRTLTRTGTSH